MNRTSRLALATLLAGLTLSNANAQTVEVAQVISKPLERKSRLPGELLPYQQVAIFGRVAGFVEDVPVDRGSRVRKGDLLVTLSAPELSAQLAEAEAKVLVVESEKAEADAKIQAAESTLARLRAASATPGAIAENDVVQADKALQAERMRRTALDEAAGAARAASAAIRDLQSYLRLTAPFDGIITERNIHPGALVGPVGGVASAPLLKLEQTDRLRLVIAVPEAEAALIRQGERLTFNLPAYPGQSFEGTVARWSSSLDPKTRTMPVELDVANPQGLLSPGMYPEVLWHVRRREPSLMLPPSSIVTTTERTFVIRVRDGRAQWVDVSRGYVVGDLVEVFGALRPGDEVLRRGSDEIRDGASLQVRRPTR
jgi:membrane fusion protein, multidrug efflux system